MTLLNRGPELGPSATGMAAAGDERKKLTAVAGTAAVPPPGKEVQSATSIAGALRHGGAMPSAPPFPAQRTDSVAAAAAAAAKLRNALLEAEKNETSTTKLQEALVELLANETAYTGDECPELIARHSDSFTTKDLTELLHHAAMLGRLDVVQKLLKHSKLDINGTLTDDKTTALASQDGHEDIVKELLNQPGRKVDQRCSIDESTPLMVAAQDGHVGVVKLLLEGGVRKKGANATLTDKDGRTAFMLACRGGHEGAAQAILTTGLEQYRGGTLEGVLEDLVLATDRRDRSAASHAALAAKEDVMEYLFECDDIPVSDDAIRKAYPQCKDLSRTAKALQGLKECLNLFVHDSVQDLRKEIRLDDMYRTGTACLVGGSLLATITSLGFVTPPGGYNPDKGYLVGRITCAVALFIFLAFNALGLFLALTSAVLSISVLSPVNKKRSPVASFNTAKDCLNYASYSLLGAVMCAAVAFAVALIFAGLVPFIDGTSTITHSDRFGFLSMLALAGPVCIFWFILYPRCCGLPRRKRKMEASQKARSTV